MNIINTRYRISIRRVAADFLGMTVREDTNAEQDLEQELSKSRQYRRCVRPLRQILEKPALKFRPRRFDTLYLWYQYTASPGTRYKRTKAPHGKLPVLKDDALLRWRNRTSTEHQPWTTHTCCSSSPVGTTGYRPLEYLYRCRIYLPAPLSLLLCLHCCCRCGWREMRYEMGANLAAAARHEP